MFVSATANAKRVYSGRQRSVLRDKRDNLLSVVYSTIGKQQNVRFLQLVHFGHSEDGFQRFIDVSAAVVSCELSNLVKRFSECFVVVLDTAFARE